MTLKVKEAMAPAADTPVSRCRICGSDRIAFYAMMTDNGHLRRADIKLPVYRCRACDVFFLNPPPPADVGREYFAQAYANEVRGSLYYNNEFKDRVSELRLKLLADYGTTGGTLLDIGCGKGQFVYAARKGGWDAWGVELDEGACEYARRQFGLETVLPGTVADAALPGTFDVVTLWDVIEHVPDPVQCLREAFDHLAPSGLIIVRTGNIRSWSFDRNPSRWWAFGSDHRFYFSPGSLSHALSAAGFRVLDVLNREIVERPDKERGDDIADTPWRHGLAAIRRSPAKLSKAGSYVRNRLVRSRGQRKYGSHYHTSIMTVIARPGRG
jgi:SAM-dependent methyltransferase